MAWVTENDYKTKKVLLRQLERDLLAVRREMWGFVSEPKERVKQCSKCYVVKPFERFYANRGVCKECLSAQSKQRYIDKKKKAGTL